MPGKASTIRAAEARTCIPNSETSVYIFLSKEQGANSIKLPVKLRCLIHFSCARAHAKIHPIVISKGSFQKSSSKRVRLHVAKLVNGVYTTKGFNPWINHRLMSTHVKPTCPAPARTARLVSKAPLIPMHVASFYSPRTEDIFGDFRHVLEFFGSTHKCAFARRNQAESN